MIKSGGSIAASRPGGNPFGYFRGAGGRRGDRARSASDHAGLPVLSRRGIASEGGPGDRCAVGRPPPARRVRHRHPGKLGEPNRGDQVHASQLTWNLSQDKAACALRS